VGRDTGESEVCVWLPAQKLLHAHLRRWAETLGGHWYLCPPAHRRWVERKIERWGGERDEEGERQGGGDEGVPLNNRQMTAKE